VEDIGPVRFTISQGLLGPVAVARGREGNTGAERMPLGEHVGFTSTIGHVRYGGLSGSGRRVVQTTRLTHLGHPTSLKAACGKPRKLAWELWAKIERAWLVQEG
jgi:hypothetical protein